MGTNTTRKRVAQACQRCRQRKFKCDGQKPECSTCKQAGQTCLYESHIRKRGLPEGYVRGMELLASLSIQHIKNFEGSLLSLLLMKKEGGSYRWQDNTEELLDIWRNSKLSFELENLLPSLSTSKSQSSKRKYEGREPELDNTPRRFAGPLSVGESDLPFAGYDQTFAGGRFIDNPALEVELSTAFDTSAVSFPFHDPMIVETRLPSNLGCLISVYFTHTHCWLPIVDKSNIMRLSFQALDQDPNVSRTESQQAILWAIAALTTLQLSNRRDTALSDESSATLAKQYYAKARELTHSDEGPFELEHVQALLIMSLTKICQAEWSSVWMLIGKAVRIAIDLDLGSPLSNTESQSRAIVGSGRCKHTMLGCFVMDTLVSCILGRDPHLRKDGADRVGAIQEDGLDEWDLWSDPLEKDPSKAHCKPIFALSTFNHLVNVCKTLNFIHVAQSCTITTASRVLLRDELGKRQTQQPFQAIFREPSTSLPLSEGILPHHQFLRLIYLCVLSILGSYSAGPRGNGLNSPDSSQVLACYTEASATLGAYFKKTDPPFLTSPCFLLASVLFQSHGNKCPDLGNTFTNQLNVWSQSSGLGQGSLPATGDPSAEAAKTLATHSSNTQVSCAESSSMTIGEPQRSMEDLLTQNTPQRSEVITDSNSVFNDFVAIDTSEWCVVSLTQFEDLS
ncbi:Quinic acid utilization activator [Penicillium rolfsii]|nr:Quinic acid utilization activator [Penicillium rolfsii]